MEDADLKKWSKENNIQERAINGFWKAFNNYINDCPDEVVKYYGILDKDKIELSIVKVYLVSKWDDKTSDYVVAEVPIKYGDKHMGKYELKFKVTGESFDDCLINKI